MIQLPASLEKVWYTRQYYGTVAHNAKAVYQKYMGWYDANPVHLNPLTPSDSARKWVEYLGDVDEVLRMARADFDKGEYQWVAEITNVLVFADPGNEAARLLCADALEQLGYQAESGPWRNAYLTAALELRHGNQAIHTAPAKGNNIMMSMTPAMLFDYMGILADKQALAEQDFTILITLSDLNERYLLQVKHGVLLVYNDPRSDAADASLTCPKNALLYIISGNAEALAALPMDGDTALITRLARSMNQFPASAPVPFNIIEP